jgi:hypothetical protein
MVRKDKHSKPRELRCDVIIKVMTWPVKPVKRERYPYVTPKFFRDIFRDAASVATWPSPK